MKHAHAIMLAGLVGCAASPEQPPSRAALRLAAIKVDLMTADYGADLAALTRLGAQAEAFEADDQLGYLAFYWAGFAHWRMALNGANEAMPAAEVASELQRAASDMYRALALKPEFADGYAAAAGINGWLIGGKASSTTPDALLERRTLASLLLSRARALAPNNPRVLWIQGGFELALPAQYGGGADKALKTFERMSAIRESAPGSPMPDWGQPEAHMMMAHAYLALTPPKRREAEREARAALAIVPGWSYVRDHLLLQITTATPP